MVDRRRRRLLDVDLGLLRSAPLAGVDGGSDRRWNAGRGVVHGRSPQLRGEPAGRPATGPARLAARVRAQGARAARLGRAAGGGAQGGVSPPPAGRRGERPRGGVHAQRSGDPGRVPRLRLHRRDLVVLLARLRGAHRDRPIRPDRAEGAPGRGRLPLRRAQLRSAWRGRQPRSGPADGGAHGRLPVPGGGGRPPRLAGGGRVGRAARARRPARPHVRAGPLRPPALGALLLGNHRSAQADRAQPRRDPARAAQDVRPPCRR